MICDALSLIQYMSFTHDRLMVQARPDQAATRPPAASKVPVILALGVLEDFNSGSRAMIGSPGDSAVAGPFPEMVPQIPGRAEVPVTAFTRARAEVARGA